MKYDVMVKAELARVKADVYAQLTELGYDAEAVNDFVNNIVRVSSYFNDKPSRVLLVNGREMFL